MKNEKLNLRYNKFVACKNKEFYDIDITIYIKEFKLFLNEIGIDESEIGNSEYKLMTECLISVLAYSNFDIKEIILEMFNNSYFKLNPETELLIAYHMEDAFKNLILFNPILKIASIIMPYDLIKNKKQDRDIIKTVICLDKIKL